jgi:hypothetical protein
MYLAIVVLTMFLLPAGSVLVEHAVRPAAPIMPLIGKWFVFFGVGVRLGLAGLRQVFQPEFTAREIFHMQGQEALPLVRELGVANIAGGVVALLSLLAPSFVVPAAISAGVFYAVAGVRHAFEATRSRNENIAMVSDLAMALVLTTFLASVAIQHLR